MDGKQLRAALLGNTALTCTPGACVNLGTRWYVYRSSVVRRTQDAVWLSRTHQRSTIAWSTIVSPRRVAAVGNDALTSNVGIIALCYVMWCVFFAVLTFEGLQKTHITDQISACRHRYWVSPKHAQFSTRTIFRFVVGNGLSHDIFPPCGISKGFACQRRRT